MRSGNVSHHTGRPVSINCFNRKMFVREIKPISQTIENIVLFAKNRIRSNEMKFETIWWRFGSVRSENGLQNVQFNYYTNAPERTRSELRSAGRTRRVRDALSVVPNDGRLFVSI